MDYREILKNSSYKMTKPRLMVLEFLENEENLVSAMDIFEGLRGEVDLVSIYRILDLFSEIGIVFEEMLDKKKYFYLSDHKHHHIVCNFCGYSECVPCEHDFDKFLNFENVTHQLLLKGVCKNCKI